MAEMAGLGWLFHFSLYERGENARDPYLCTLFYIGRYVYSKEAEAYELRNRHYMYGIMLSKCIEMHNIELIRKTEKKRLKRK